MELRNIGSSFLRSRPHSFPVFLTPSLGTCRFFVANGNPFDSVLLHHNSPQRNAFSTCGSPIQAPSATPVPSPTPEPDSEEPSPASFVRHMNHKEISLLIDEMPILNGPVRRYTQLPISPKNQSSKSEGPILSSLDLLRTSFNRRASEGSIYDQMIIPRQRRSEDALNSTGSSSFQTPRVPLKKPFKQRSVRTIESRPKVGRTIELNGRKGIDLATALRKLHQECARNNVRYDRSTQRFHERPGLKRKRLQRLWWRARFMEGFKALVGKVHAMRRKGW